MKRKNKNNIIYEKILEYKIIINIVLLIVLCILIIGLIAITIKKQKEYNVQGEKKLPFTISEVNIFSKFNIERKEEDTTDKAIISMLDDVVLKYKNTDNNRVKKITYKDIKLLNIDSIDKYELYTINMNESTDSGEKTVEGDETSKTIKENNMLKNINKKIENKEITFLNNNIENNNDDNNSKEVTTFFRILYDKKKEKIISKEELIKYNELSKEEDLEVYKNIKVKFMVEIEMLDGKIYETEITISKDTPIKENNLIKYKVTGIENLKFKRKN